jgi:hypothetical protein
MEQTFNVTLSVFDTTQIIQITPNSCPTGGINPGAIVPIFATVSNSENVGTGNPIPPFGNGSIPNYPNFLINGSQAGQNVIWSLIPWTPTTQYPVGGPQGAVALNACIQPAGGASIAGIGTISNNGPISQSQFVAANPFGSNPGGNVHIYACRPTVTPAWSNSSLWIEDPTKNPPPPDLGFQSWMGPIPTLSEIACPLNNTGGGGTGGINMLVSRIGVLRGNTFNFDSNGNGQGPAPNDPADRVDLFTPTGGVQAGDIGIIGDWTGDGHSKAGWFRPTGGQWFLDTTNAGGTAAAPTFTGFGGPGDTPVIGDWAGLGKQSIGIVTGGGGVNPNFLWVVDTVGNGVFASPTPVCTPLAPPTPTPVYPNCGTDTVNMTGTSIFPFGGAPGDVMVVGNWFNRTSASTGQPISQAGLVRASGAGAPPFLWVLDGGIAGTASTVTPLAGGAWSATVAYNANDIVTFGGASYISQCPTVSTPFGTACPQTNFNLNHAPNLGLPWMLINQLPNSIHGIGNTPVAFGGFPGDIPVVGDWFNTGVTQFGMFRQGFLWMLDSAVPTAPQASHVAGIVVPYGGLSIDKPIVGKW